MLKMERLCVVCAVERVMAAYLKPKLLNLENLVVNTKKIAIRNSMFHGVIPC